MSDQSSIEWTDATVNPVPGCLRVSPGCGTHEGGCYAEKMAWRLAHNPATPQYAGTVRMTKQGPRWTGVVGWAPTELDKIRAWKKPRRIFVESMGDVFFEAVPREHVDAIFDAMEACPQHTFQVLTKRPAQMADYVEARYGMRGVPDHIWLGTTVENNEQARLRIPHLLRCRAKVRWLSCEPLLEELDLDPPLCPYCRDGGEVQRIEGDTDVHFWCVRCDSEAVFGNWLDACASKTQPGISWVVVGGESGRKARGFHVEWARSIVRQCRDAGLAVFVKQLGANPLGLPEPELEPAERGGKRRLRVLIDSHGGDPGEWPSDLNVREFPVAA